LLPDQGADRARAKRKKKARPVESPAFVAWYAEYPRKVAREHAAAMWSERGCDELAEVIMAALHTQIAYWRAQPIDKVPHPGSWLNGTRWIDDPQVYRVGAMNGGLHRNAPDTRCAWHRDPRNDSRASRYPDKRCDRCKHFAASGAGRTGDPESAADALPSWASSPPPAAWTPEQIAEAEELRRNRRANGGTT